MKISKADRERNRARIIRAAVREVTQHGYREATLKQIALRAEVAEPTLYKYFPSKEAILFGYFGSKMDEVIAKLKEVERFHEYDLQEQLNILIDTNFEVFEGDEEFLLIAYERALLGNWVSAHTGSIPSRDKFYTIVEDLVQSAVEVEEIPEIPFPKLIYGLLWEYMIAVDYYWLKDRSKGKTQTAQLVDKSLGMIYAALKSGILNKATDLFHFIVREHFINQMKSDRKERKINLDKTKRRFMNVRDI